MKITFPIAVNPPKLVKPYGPTLGYIVAVVAVMLGVIQLFRIDTLLPIVMTALGTQGRAMTFVIVVTCAEVFAIPFALRMKLSPLAHVMSGFMITLAPLMWTLLAIWCYGTGMPTGQLGEFVSLPSSWWLIAINLFWLALSFTALWALGYNNMKIKDMLQYRTSKKHAKS